MMTDDKFQEIYHQYYQLVKSVVYDILKDIDFAEDICQEVFLMFAEKASFLNERYYQYWLIVSAKRKAIDFCRKSYQVHEVTTEAFPQEEVLYENESEWNSNSISNRNSFEDRVMNKIVFQEFTGKLFEDLAKKDSVWYEIVIRLYVENQDAEQVARDLGISIETLRTKKHRIKKWIKKNYSDKFNDC